MNEIYTDSSGVLPGSSGSLLYRIGHAAELVGVSVDTLRRWVDDGRLAAVRTSGGQRLVHGADLARLARERAAESGSRTGAGAGSGSGAGSAEGRARVSARNRFAGLVTRVVTDELMAQVEIQAGPYRVVSLMTREAAEDMGLTPGVEAVAVVKSTNVVVERPPQ